MGTTTTTFALNKPTVGGNDNAWGGDWNANADRLDDILESSFTQTRDTVALLLADTLLTYTSGQVNTVSSGKYVVTRSEGFAYQVAASGATDHHIVTAGGVKLYVLPGADGYNVKAFGAVGDNTADDTAEVQAAVTQAFTVGDTLYWPDGTYLTTSSISNLHSVNHFGPGIIQRGANAFYVAPRGSQSNTVFIATTGNNASDGLSSSQPRLTFQSAFDAVANYGKPVLDGVWNIVAAAGTYTIASGQQTFSTPSKNRVVIRGPSVSGHPNVPTCIVDGGGNGAAYDHGLSASGVGVRVEFRDIKFQNFSEASDNTRIGLVGESECDFYSVNVHTFNCSWCGIYNFSTIRARISGGIIDANNVAGAQCYIANDTQSTVGFGATNVSQGPIIKNGPAGIYWSRGSQGHVDYTTIQDCATGLYVDLNSRVHAVSCDFKRNTLAVRTANSSAISETSNNYNNGTADANTTNTSFGAYSGQSLEGQNAQSYLRVDYDRTTRTASGAASYSFPTIYTLPAYRLQGVGKSMRVHIKGIYTVTASSTVVVNIGGMAVTFGVPAAATSVAFTVDFELMDVSGGYRAIGSLSAGLSAARFATATAGFNVTVASAVNVSGNLTGAGDSINIYRTDIYLMG